MQTTISVKRNKRYDSRNFLFSICEGQDFSYEIDLTKSGFERDIAAFEYDKAMLAQDLLKARAAFYGELKSANKATKKPGE